MRLNRSCFVFVVISIVMLSHHAVAHEDQHLTTIVIDTDMGLDDTVTLAMALQAPRSEIVGIVASEGVSSGLKCVDHLERMLSLFNRQEIPLYKSAHVETTKSAPPFRSFAENAIAHALPEKTSSFHRAFVPDAYVSNANKTIVLVLGPLTNLATALKTKPEIKEGIDEVLVAGPSKAARNWNVQWDPAALAAVQASGLTLEFVVGGAAGRKPESWQNKPLTIGQGTSIGERFMKRLLADHDVHKHYMNQFTCFYDELVFLYYLDPALFQESSDRNVFAPRARQGVIDLFTQLMSNGRQHRMRTVFAEEALPDAIFQKDVSERKARIIANNGKEEWFAQLLMNELHEHLGAYSVIGAKMGLYAAELLNAPRHGMNIVSRAAAHPPVSCLNDGVIVSTGSTPGRCLFVHQPGPPGSTQVVFTFNERYLRLALKQEYQTQISTTIKTLLQNHTLADDEYWDGVRRLGLDIWEKWHRRELFEVVTDHANTQMRLHSHPNKR